MKTASFNFNVEARAYFEGAEMVLEGYPIVCNEKADMGFFDEEITKEALEKADISDVVLNKQHDDGCVVARTTNNTLILEKDEKGLKMIAKLSQNRASKELFEDVKAGLLNKMSFRAEFLNEILDETSERPVVKVTDLGKIFDVSVVAFPAYDQTEVIARAKLFEIKEREDQKMPENEEVVDTVEKETDNNEVLDAIAKIDEKVEKLNGKVDGVIEDVTKLKEEKESEEEEVEVVEDIKKTNEEEKERFLRQDAKIRFYASLGNKVAERQLANKDYQVRATAHGVTNLLDNHTEGSAVELVDEVAFESIMEQMKDMSPILSQVHMTGIAGTIKYFYEKDGSTGAVWLEDAEKGTGEKVELGLKKISADRLQKLVYASDELRETSIADFENFIQREVAREMAYALEVAIFAGTGTGKPLGFIYDPDISVIEVPAATNFTGILAKLLPAIKSFYRQNSNIYMNSEDYFAEYLLAEDKNGQLMDYTKILGNIKVFPSDEIPSGTYAIGDFYEYKLNIAKKVEFQYSDDFLFDQNVRTYRSYMLAGGGVRNPKAFAIVEKQD